jgi:DNA-binding MarR family transcriptional regulator/GNAT superfamily N-acetyltransferase
MQDAATQRVRSFHRVVTQRIGALHDEYLARGRSLGASRMLWEIGHDGADLRELRVRLDLDSGYLSRLLRSLEQEGLVAVEASAPDRRVRTARLTAAGRAELALLDERSDELARSLLAPLGEAQRTRLVDAMDVVERLLTATLVQVGIEDPAGDAGRSCIESYFAELERRFDGGYVSRPTLAAATGELTVFLVARLRGEPIGCGGLVLHGEAPAEIRRMWVAPSVRGLGVGRRILGEIEQQARERGVAVVRLETNRTLTEAASLYRSAGYAETEQFGNELDADHWFEKRLTSRAS